MAGYEYNPLLPLNLQKRSAVSPSDIEHLEQEIASINEDITDINGDLKNKVPKVFTSIEELEISEIGEYQGETNETFIRGDFYERGSGEKEIKYTEVSQVTLLKQEAFFPIFQTVTSGIVPNQEFQNPLQYNEISSRVGGFIIFCFPVSSGVVTPCYVENFNVGFYDIVLTGYLLATRFDSFIEPSIPIKIDDNNKINVFYDNEWIVLDSFIGAAIMDNHRYNCYVEQDGHLVPASFFNTSTSAVIFPGDDTNPDTASIAYRVNFVPIELSRWTTIERLTTLYNITFVDVPSITHIGFAKLAQGAKADTALQSISVGTDGDYITTTVGTKDANNNQTVGVSAKIQDIATADNDNKGFAESSNVKAYAATAAQGAKADTALQSISVGTDGNYITTTIGTKDANNNQTVGVSAKIQDIATADSTHKGFAESSNVKAYAATAAQGAKADTALQSIAHGTDGNYVTSHIGSKDANNVQTVDVSLQLQAVETADISHKGVAEANDVKEYVSKSIASYIPYNPVYGVMWDTSDPSPECVRIGNLDLHRTLPVQSQMVGGTLTDAGVFTPFASVDDWTTETRDGSAGQVMVRLPQFWIKYVTEGPVNKVLMSADEVSGFQKVPVMYVSAYKAALQRSTLKLASVVNTDADYRGGNNQSAWDGTYRSLLGYPVTDISLTDFRTYARNRAAGTEWNCAVYEIHKLLYWLFVVEYATLNTQKDYNAALDANSYHQGGLGVGVTDWSGDAWNSFNGYYPLIPCGHTDEYGNQTAQKQYNLYNSDGTTILHSFQVPRYRGVESPYGDVWEWTDGMLIPKQADSDGGKSPVYVTSDPAKFSSTDYSQYDYVCDEIRAEAYVKSIYFGNNGDLICTATPGSSTSYYCDYWYGANLPSSGVSLRALPFGGSASLGARAGFVYGNSGHGPGDVNARIGSRLCFIPNNV